MKVFYTAKILIVFILIAFTSAAFFPQLASAQLFGPVVPTHDAETNFNLGAVISTGDTAIVNVIGVPGTSAAGMQVIRTTLSATCQTAISALDKGDVVNSVIDSTSDSALASVGGSPVEATKLATKIAKATAVKVCVDNYILLLSQASSDTVTFGQDLQREQDKYTKISNTLKTLIENLTQQQNSSVKDIIKAFLVKTILTLQKNLTTELVNKMVEKYKISDYLAYGNAVASEVYDMKYINSQYSGDVKTQLMVRSMLQSNKFPEQLQTVYSLASSKAASYVGSACNGVNNSPTSGSDEDIWLKCLSAYGDPNANPMLHVMNTYDQAQATHAAGISAMQQEIASSNGYAPARDCSGSLAQQKQIDSQVQADSQEVLNAAAVLKRLQAGHAASSEIAKAQADLDAAQKRQAASLSKLGASGGQVGPDNKVNDGAIVDVCKAIDSPSAFISGSINEFLKEHLDQSSQIKTENLPFYLSFGSDVVANFTKNILTGGKSTSQVLKEAGVGALQTAVLGSIQAVNSGGGGINGNAFNQVKITAFPATGSESQATTTLRPNTDYVLLVDFSQISEVAPVRIYLDGFNTGRVPFDLSQSEITSHIFKYRSFGSGTKSFTVTVQFDLSNSDGSTTLSKTFSQPFTVSNVAGAQTILVRGPAVTPRGN